MDNNDKAKLLVAYATEHGATEEVARFIGQVLAEKGVSVDVKSVDGITDLEDYSGVIIGAPVYSSNWHQPAQDFVKEHQKTLKAMPTALFALAIRLRDQSDEMLRVFMDYLDTPRILAKPVSIGLFAGALFYDRLSPITRLNVETKGLPEGDFRQWDDIRAWAEDTHAKMMGSTV